MKKISILLILAIALSIGFNACNKSDFTEEDAINLINDRNNEATRLQDSIDNANTLLNDAINDANTERTRFYNDSVNNANNKVYLTVFAIDISSNYMQKSTRGIGGALANASVTVYAADGPQTVTTDAAGAASFELDRGGNYAISVIAAGYTTLELKTTYLSSGVYASMNAPLLSTTTNLMTVEGKVTYEKDITNISAEECAGAIVHLTPNWTNISNIFSNNSVATFTYSGFVTSATTDATGMYSIQVPSDLGKKVQYNLSIEDYKETAQVILANSVNGVSTVGAGKGTQTVAAVFGSSVGSTNYPPTSVPAVYGVFSAPTYAYTPASLTANLYNANSLDHVQVNTVGKGYYNGARAWVKNPTDTTKFAVYYISASSYDGIIDGNNSYVWTSGSNFSAVPTMDLAFEQKAASFKFSTDATGKITAITLVNGGLYLANEANLDFTVPTGTGATFNIFWTSTTAKYKDGSSVSGTSYRTISSISINNGGTGYGVSLVDATTAKIVVNAAKTSLATATAFLSTGSVSSVNIVSGGVNYKPNSTWPLVFSNGNAGGYASSDASGVIKTVVVTSTGSNYTTAPTVTIDVTSNTYGGAMPANKTAVAVFGYTTSNNTVYYNGMNDNGAGYTGPATLTLYSQADPTNALTGLVYKVNMGSTTTFPTNVSSVSFTTNDPGIYIPHNMNYAGASVPTSTFSAAPGEKVVKNIYLGGGARTATIN
jgi:hypothetical protein